MQCMEVWGGNQSTNNGVVMAGLDAWVYSKPFGGSDGGGDVYYVSACATGRILRLMIADVAGHGQTVGTIATQLRGLMRQHVNQIDQTQFVCSMNNQFSKFARNGTFATAVVSTYFAPTRRLSLCNAGHPLPLLYRAATKQWALIEGRSCRKSDNPTNLPFGILDIVDYQTFDIGLKVGDLVLCYTDSLIESRGADGQMLGHAGLLDIARSVDVADPATVVPALLSAIEGAYPGNLTNDDVTILLFRPNGVGAGRPSFAHQVGGLRKLIASIARSFRPGSEPVPWPDLKLPNVGGAIFPPLQRLWSTRAAPRSRKNRK
jgi:sigma-B regulation protein RsbU (phosphoserine phosphatase)